MKKQKTIEYNPASKDGLRWVENVTPALRFVGYADKLSARGIRHTGWYTDEDNASGETLRGVVYQLSGKEGQPRYIAGYADPINDNAARLDFTVIKSDMVTAAYRADRIAEIEAEKAREYNEAWQAGNRFADILAEIKEARTHVIELIRAIKLHRKDTVETIICDTLRANVRSWLRDITKLKKERNTLLDDFSAAWRKDVHETFNEGAGTKVIA